MIVGSVNHIAKSFRGNIIFEDLSFEVHERNRVGLVDETAAGKPLC